MIQSIRDSFAPHVGHRIKLSIINDCKTRHRLPIGQTQIFTLCVLCERKEAFQSVHRGSPKLTRSIWNFPAATERNWLITAHTIQKAPLFPHNVLTNVSSWHPLSESNRTSTCWPNSGLLHERLGVEGDNFLHLRARCVNVKQASIV